MDYDAIFRAKGFLTEPPAQYLAGLRRPHAALFDYCDRLNQRAMEIAWGLKPRKSELNLMIGAALFVKALNSFQAAIVLVSRGMAVEGQAISRTGIECAIELAAMAKDPQHVQKLLAAHQRHRATHAKQMLRHDEVIAQVTDPLVLAELQAAALLTGASHSLEASAAKAGLSVLYDAMYRGVSGYAAHATIGAVQGLFVADGDILKLLMGPDVTLIPEALVTAVPIVLQSLPPLGVLFNIAGLDQEALRLANEWEDLALAATKGTASPPQGDPAIPAAPSP